MLLDTAIGVWGGVNHEGCGGEEGRGGQSKSEAQPPCLIMGTAQR